MAPRTTSNSSTGSTTIFVATTSFACELNGTPYNVTKGERVRAGHELLRAYAESFSPLEDGHVHYDVEQASAAPGEKRAR